MHNFSLEEVVFARHNISDPTYQKNYENEKNKKQDIKIT